MKTCAKCKEPKANKEFYKNRSEPDGLHPWCKLCRKPSDKKHYLAIKTWALVREWRSSLVRRYNITYEQYNVLLAEQNGVCAVCGKPEFTQRQLCVDHDHSCCTGDTSCGKCIRGLLCSKCNRGLGLLQDSCKVVEKALAYLRRPLEQRS